MKRKFVLGFFLAALTLSLLAACGASQSPSTTSSTSTKYTVTMGATSFDATSITIPKGSTITFVTQQGGTAHNLVNGSDGQVHPESGAATFTTSGQVVSPGSSWTTTPWTTAGTFHVTCTYHPTTMTITIVVTG